MVEAVNGADEGYGEARLLKQLQSQQNSTAAGWLSGLMADVNRFVGRAIQHDDITLLVLRCGGRH